MSLRKLKNNENAVQSDAVYEYSDIHLFHFEQVHQMNLMFL